MHISTYVCFLVEPYFRSQKTLLLIHCLYLPWGTTKTILVTGDCVQLKYLSIKQSTFQLQSFAQFIHKSKHTLSLKLRLSEVSFVLIFFVVQYRYCIFVYSLSSSIQPTQYHFIHFFLSKANGVVLKYLVEPNQLKAKYFSISIVLAIVQVRIYIQISNRPRLVDLSDLRIIRKSSFLGSLVASCLLPEIHIVITEEV